MSTRNDDFPTDSPAVVTCGLPYANGDLHIGHLRGYIGADAFNRALQTLGQQTAYVCGSDMHGTPVAVNAEQEGVDPEDFALEWHEQYEETFPKFNVEFDNYGHTHDETNTELTQEIVRTLDEEGYIYEKEIQVAYDPDADQYLPDRYVEGTCPYCGEKARGDECDEGCQRHLEPGEVEDPTSTITGNPAEYRERPHKFFEVSEFSEFLTEFLDELEGTSNARNQPRQWIEDGLQDWCITRDMDWGIDYPNRDDAEGDDLVLYVWVDAPIEYIASSKQYSERVGTDTFDWEQVWKGDGEIMHVIGRDIIQHHAIFWPAMLEGAGYNKPRGIAATGFITINGKGLSTSRNRAIWAKEYLEEGFHPDLLRYYLTTTGGLQQDVDFSWDASRRKSTANSWARSATSGTARCCLPTATTRARPTPRSRPRSTSAFRTPSRRLARASTTTTCAVSAERQRNSLSSATSTSSATNPGSSPTRAPTKPHRSSATASRSPSRRRPARADHARQVPGPLGATRRGGRRI